MRPPTLGGVAVAAGGGAPGAAPVKGSMNGAMKGAGAGLRARAGGGAGASPAGERAGERAGPSSGGACAAAPARVKSVRWNLPEGEPGGSGEGRAALIVRARARAMKRAGKASRSWLLPPEARGGGAGGGAGPGESSVLNKIFSAPGSACLEVKGKNSLGYIVNKAFMSKNRKMERQIEKLLRENAQLKRS